MKLKTKDFVSLALYTALFAAVSMIGMMLSSMAGNYGHAISPGFMYLIGGPVIFFVAHKVGKMWQFTIMTLLMCGVYTIMGAAYLPWFITMLIGSVIADLMVSKTNKPSNLKLAIANGIMAVGCALGSIIPAMFFAEQFKQDWIERGQTAEYMEETIRVCTGTMGYLATLIVFVLGFVGIYLGYILLKKHLKLD